MELRSENDFKELKLKVSLKFYFKSSITDWMNPKVFNIYTIYNYVKYINEPAICTEGLRGKKKKTVFFLFMKMCDLFCE